MQRLGLVYALLAAMCNGTIGIFNRYGLDSGGDYVNISFLKAFLAFALLTAYMAVDRSYARRVAALRPTAGALALLAFFGIFVLYFFETWAVAIAPIPAVAFLLYAGGLVTIVLGITVLGESANAAKWLAAVLIFLGVFLLLDESATWEIGSLGAFLAIVAGTGYALFIFFGRALGIPGGLAALWWLFGFGSAYLGVPFVAYGASLPAWKALPAVLGLVLVPTLGGYYCTTKALSEAEAGRVQMLETSDPLFATLFAFVLFGETIGVVGIAGGVLVFIGILLAMRPARPSPGRDRAKFVTAAPGGVTGDGGGDGR